jgi:hypothetical protein
VQEHLRRSQDNEKRLRQSEIALQRKIEEEQEETLAVSKARDNSMADVKKHQVPPRIHMRPHKHAPAYARAGIRTRVHPRTHPRTHLHTEKSVRNTARVLAARACMHARAYMHLCMHSGIV